MKDLRTVVVVLVRARFCARPHARLFYFLRFHNACCNAWLMVSERVGLCAFTFL
jgi:hypothetical protein